MKINVTTALAVLGLFISSVTFAQSPQMFNYQGIARDNAGNTLSNQSITLRTSILADSPSGTLVYQEVHGINTSQLGIFTLKIGDGSVVSGNLQSIDWGSTSYFIQVEMDADGGNDFQNLGASQLLSVPYALYSESSGNKSLNDSDDDTKIQVEESADEDIIRFNVDGTEQLKISNNASGAPLFEVNSVSGNLYIGKSSGNSDSGSSNTFIGHFSGDIHSSGTLNTFLGAEAAREHEVGGDNTFVGARAGFTNENGSGNIFIGRSSGYFEQGSDKLYIANSNTSSPLVFGDFAKDSLSINGSLTAKDDFAQSGRFIATLLNIQDDSYANGLKIQVGENSQSVNNRFISFVRPDGSEVGAVRQITSSSVDFWSPSDRRLKTNIQNTQVGIEDLMHLQVKDYVYKDDLEKPQTGFIAQEVFEVFPNAVSPGSENAKTDPWMMNYGKLTPLLVKAIQDQQSEIEALKTSNEAILKELQELKNK